ncbi:MAG: triose-phosphate isomerase [Candidatus Omnitrophica bacterium]|jgi:triosephosphate isomerase|nr:triose-phosphate isomerase [Candidatus Omnitrophota bacterium]
MRRPFIAGNWKMYKTNQEALELVNGLKRELADLDGADIVVCPPFTALSDVSDLLIDSNIKLGAQNLYWQEEGAFTGEISPVMLKDIGCQYVIIGHSERRKYFLESDEEINKKIKAAIKNDLIPIFCLGETLQEREDNKTISIVEKQLKTGLAGLEEDSINKIIIAYEPVWAIGTGKTATPQIAQEVHQFIRSWIAKNISSLAAENLKILYGGSVKPSNAKDLIKQPDIDGALVGGASLEISSFVEIIKNSL